MRLGLFFITSLLALVCAGQSFPDEFTLGVQLHPPNRLYSDDYSRYNRGAGFGMYTEGVIECGHGFFAGMKGEIAFVTDNTQTDAFAFGMLTAFGPFLRKKIGKKNVKGTLSGAFNAHAITPSRPPVHLGYEMAVGAEVYWVRISIHYSSIFTDARSRFDDQPFEIEGFKTSYIHCKIGIEVFGFAKYFEGGFR